MDQFGEEGEYEMMEGMDDGEMGESEVEEDDGEDSAEEGVVDYNKLAKIESDSSDSEEDIIAGTIKGRLAKQQEKDEKEAKKQASLAKKYQKVEKVEPKVEMKIDSKSIKEVGVSLKQDLDDFKDKVIGKEGAIDDKRQNLTIDFEYVAPSDPYFHIIRSLLG